MSRLNEYLEAIKDTRFIKDPELNKYIQIAIDNCKDPYAQAYLHKMIEAWDQYGDEGLETQILYALNNMTTWRGEQARETKTFFKDFIKKMNKKNPR